MNRLRIAIQKKGRLSEESISFLKSKGLMFDSSGENLMVPCSNAEVDIFLLRSSDIPEYVAQGVADFGITGENVLLESNVPAQVVEKLPFAFCRLAIAIPENSKIESISNLEGERIATSYSTILSRFLQKNEIHASIIPITGSVEVAPELNLSDAICDVVQTGNTLKLHRLKELTTILSSQAVLIESPFPKEGKPSLFSASL